MEVVVLPMAWVQVAEQFLQRWLVQGAGQLVLPASELAVQLRLCIEGGVQSPAVPQGLLQKPGTSGMFLMQDTALTVSQICLKQLFCRIWYYSVAFWRLLQWILFVGKCYCDGVCTFKYYVHTYMWTPYWIGRYCYGRSLRPSLSFACCYSSHCHYTAVSSITWGSRTMKFKKLVTPEFLRY